MGTDPVGEFVAKVQARLERGAQEYGDRSFQRPVAELVDEVQQELLDVVGWVFVLWTLGARKIGLCVTAAQERSEFLARLRRRIVRNDRGAQPHGVSSAMHELELFAMDAFATHEVLMRRLVSVAMRLQSAIAAVPPPPPLPSQERRGKHGSISDPRSSD